MEVNFENILKEKEQQVSAGTSIVQIESTSEEATENLSKDMGDTSLRNVEIVKLKASL